MMSLGYDTCVYCIVLDDAGPDVAPHKRLLLSTAGVHRCEICSTCWRCQPVIGWRRQPASSEGVR